MWREAKFATHLVFGGLGGVFASVAMAAAGAGAGAGRAVRVWKCVLWVWVFLWFDRSCLSLVYLF